MIYAEKARHERNASVVAALLAGDPAGLEWGCADAAYYKEALAEADEACTDAATSSLDYTEPVDDSPRDW